MNIPSPTGRSQEAVPWPLQLPKAQSSSIARDCAFATHPAQPGFTVQPQASLLES